MKQNELEKQLAKEAGLTRSAARDEVNEVVLRVLESLREGKSAELPGVGVLFAKTAVVKTAVAAPASGEGSKAARK